MSLYDGNQLPENLTSNLQLVVSLVYTLMMTFFLCLGGFATWATSRQLTRPQDAKGGDGTTQLAIGQSRHPTEYMSELVQKRNAIVRGLMAFIPAVFSLVHLYTSSLHSSSIYGTGQVVYGALLAYAALYMGKTLQQLVLDSDHMDTTKAVYETLYMLASAFDRLSMHKPDQTAGIFKKAQDALPKPGSGRGSTPAWRSPWVLYNVFVGIGAQDDARLWPMFSAWLGRFQLSNFLVYVPGSDTLLNEVLEFWLWPTWLVALWPSTRYEARQQKLRDGAKPTTTCRDRKRYNVAYAYWLFSQDKLVRTITGSMVVNQGVADEVTLAGCRSRNLYFAAKAYMDTLTAHVIKNLKDMNGGQGIKLTFITRDNKHITFDGLAHFLRRVFYPNHLGLATLSMVCERYACRHTPAFAALCLPTHNLVPRLFLCWEMLYGSGDALTTLLESSADPGYWCHLWLAYMHVVLVGVDLLRMNTNKEYFEGIPLPAGFLDLGPDLLPRSPNLDPELERMSLYDLSDGNLYGVAACMATVLLHYRMWEEGVLKTVSAPAVQQVTAPTAQDPEVILADLRPMETAMLKAGLQPSFYDDYMQQRSTLVLNNTSLPATVRGVECLSAVAWVDDAMWPVKLAVIVVGIAAAATATIGCSKGVFLVALSGLVQSFAAWCLLLHTDRLPARPASMPYHPSFHYRLLLGLAECIAWLFCALVRPVWLMGQGLTVLFPPNWFYWSLLRSLLLIAIVVWDKVTGWTGRLASVARGLLANIWSKVRPPAPRTVEGGTTVTQGAGSSSHGSAAAAGDGTCQEVVVDLGSTAANCSSQSTATPTPTGSHDNSKAPTPGTTSTSKETSTAEEYPRGADLAAEGAATLAAAVAIAATATRAVDALKEPDADCRVSEAKLKGFNADVDNIKRKVGMPDPLAGAAAIGNEIDHGSEPASSAVNSSGVNPCMEYDGVLGSVLDLEKAAIRDSAQPMKDPSLVDNKKFIKKKGTQPAYDHYQAATFRLRIIRWQASSLFLRLCQGGVSLQSCFESECRRFYRDRINPWNVTLKFLTAVFFYAFAVFLALSVVQEPWYAGRGMCWGRCLNGTDCWAEQNIGMPGADNSFGGWANLTQLQKLGLPLGPPVCPGTGSIALQDRNKFGCQHCPWMETVFNITVSPPVYYHMSGNTTLCKAEVRVFNLTAANHTVPPSTGTLIPVMWQSMFGGRNEDNSSQVSVVMRAATNETGYATFVSPLSKPFNSSSGYGCNITVLAEEITSFSAHESANLTSNVSWGCVDCAWAWEPPLPRDGEVNAHCEALCESHGISRHTFRIQHQNNSCGKPCDLQDGQNTTVPCYNPLFCNCTGIWLESKPCDAACESKGHRTMTYHVTKPASKRWVGYKLVPGADCPAKDMQTREEACVNHAPCTVGVHADVYTNAGPAMHGNLVPTSGGQPP